MTLDESIAYLEKTVKVAVELMVSNRKHIEELNMQIKYYKTHYDQAKARTAYPEFCKHPGKCAGTGRCMAEWVCND